MTNSEGKNPEPPTPPALWIHLQTGLIQRQLTRRPKVSKERDILLSVPTKKRAGSNGDRPYTHTHTGPRREAASPKTTGRLGTGVNRGFSNEPSPWI